MRSQLCVSGAISTNPMVGKGRGIPVSTENFLKIRIYPSSLLRMVPERCLSIKLSEISALPFICPLKIVFCSVK